MRQIKEKSTETAATVNGANHKDKIHIENTIKNLIRQVEYASEVSQTDPSKAPYQISEYLEYCDCVGKQPNKTIINVSMLESISEQEKELTESEFLQNMKKLSPANRIAIIELMEFMVWKSQQNKSYIA